MVKRPNELHRLNCNHSDKKFVNRCIPDNILRPDAVIVASVFPNNALRP